MPLISMLSYFLVLMHNISLDSQCTCQKTKTDAMLNLLHFVAKKKKNPKVQNNKTMKTEK